jgi:large subunit ribosomal protein L22
MGRAYRYQRRLTHIVLSVAERDGGHSHLVTKADEPETAKKPSRKTAVKKAAPKKTAAKKPVAATKKKAKK